MNEIKEFLKALTSDPRAKELLQGMKEPASMEETAEQYGIIAEKLGFSISRENILEYLNIREKMQKEQTANAEGAVKTALSEEDLQSVAGGIYTNCSSTSQPADKEWCWFSDACHYVINFYEDDHPPVQTSVYCDNMTKAPKRGSGEYDETYLNVDYCTGAFLDPNPVIQPSVEDDSGM